MAITLQLNQHPPLQTLVKTCVDMGYQRVPMVLAPGEIAVRGSIVDIFAYNHSHPIRVDYFGDHIESIHSFYVHTQRDLSPLVETVISEVPAQKSLVAAAGTHDTAADFAMEMLASFQEGDVVVHVDYGIGIYRGIRHLVLNGREGDYVLIHYLGEDKIYVPIDQIHRVHAYSGSDTPKIGRLHDGSWERTKSKAQKTADSVIEELYVLYKARRDMRGIHYREDSAWQVDFEHAFPYELTPDQAQAISDIKADMESPFPMDRLLCGDVGFGKTEVLLRAAFKAVDNERQVAVLVPTTILGLQHYHTFLKRFSGFPFRVALLSRFQSPSEQKQIIADIRAHKVDVVIGTHRLLQKDISFAELGLMIVDEEQRFGVTHKEKLKQMTCHVDVLSVSATPIPRTLYMALAGARDMSLIKTPPIQKKPIRTAVMPYSDEIVQLAITQEINRNGQVFYLFNDVKLMAKKYRHLKKLMPNISIAMAHAQLDEQRLQDVMQAFLEGRYQVLLCSTIIENGVDMPRVNTLILERAERFGLSQIHQIRGRVGRAHTQGHAFLLFSEGLVLTESAEKRLEAIREYAALGAGYQLALRDLEIRGAGHLLGKEQHGMMVGVGFELFCQLMEESLRRKKKTVSASWR